MKTQTAFICAILPHGLARKKHGEHGLFGAEDAVDLEKTLGELKAHEGNVWTIIYSLRREDAARGFCASNAGASALQTGNFAEAIKIPTVQLRWYAAFPTRVSIRIST